MKLLFNPLWTFIVVLTLLTYSACRKTDQTPEQQKETLKISVIEDKFFNSNRTNDPTEKALVDFIKWKNDKEKFVEKTVTQIGYPRWDKAVTTSSRSKIMGRGNSDSSLATYYVPFVRDSQNYVNASMIIKTYPTDTTISYKCDWQYSQTQNNINSISDSSEYLVIFFMVLDKHVFGHTKFIITDTNIFKNSSKKPLYVTLDTVSVSGKNNLLTPIQVCQDVTITFEFCPWIYNQGFCYGPGGACDNCGACFGTLSYQYCWTDYIDDGSGGGGTGGGGTGGSGGSGSGGGSTPPPCGGPVAARNQILQGCEPGWNPDPTPIPTITYLTNTLGLSSSQVSFLIQNPSYQGPLYSYISQNYSSQSVQICKDHIDLLMSEPDYVLFVNNHNSTGNHSVAWWMDDTWLDNPQYFNLDPYDDYKKLTAAEKALVKQYPTAAFIMNKFNRPMATNFTVQKFGSNGLNDKSDAFRHAFFQALNTVRIGATLTQQFSEAHETETPNQLIKEKQMDLFNNSVGIAYGQTQSYPTSTPVMIADAVYIKVLNGELRYLLPIWPPKFNPSGQLINPSGDPNFYGPNGTNNPTTATHGIIATTVLTPTNQ